MIDDEAYKCEQEQDVSYRQAGTMETQLTINIYTLIKEKTPES